VKLAEQAAKATDYAHPLILDILAAA